MGNGANVQKMIEANKLLTPEERSRRASIAGKASVESRRRIKSQREILRHILAIGCDDEEACEALKALGLEPDFANAANLAVLRKAVRGDVEALRYIRDTIGEKPTEQTQLSVLNQPVKALDMTKLSDAELQALADRDDVAGWLPESGE